MTAVLLGVDIGTASTKGCLTDARGRVLRRAERAHTTSSPKSGWFEHDADTIWWAEFTAVCRELLAGDLPAPDALCVSGIGPCLLPAESDGSALRPAILYGVDTRATREIDELNQLLGADRILARGGSPLTSQAVGPKILWLRRNEPEVWQRCRRLFMASSHIVYRLTGEYVLDHHSASQCNPMYDLMGKEWALDWCTVIAPGLELPRLCSPLDQVGCVTESAAAATGIRPGTPVVAGTIDAWAEAASVEVRSPGDLMLMYGTTMFLVQVSTLAQPSPHLWLTRGVAPEHLTVAAGMATSGALTAWFRELTGSDFDDLFDAGAKVPAGSEGLLVLPYFAGERTPIFDPDARGVIAGLTLGHGRGHIFRALLEATAFGVRHNLEAMAEVAGAPTQMTAVGGGTRSRLWVQIVSDVCGIEQQIRRESVGACFGDAWMAGVGLGLVGPDQEWNPLMETVPADPRVRDAYDRMYSLYRQLYHATSAITHQLR
ncbi:MAG TPA: FGGY-family carbohydrate kinase [Candidatus Dormibacteraeota bacterium]|nr:FGGY-family carbohydrate kinase [Candidatus Dormibacteraeota bacterium]